MARLKHLGRLLALFALLGGLLPLAQPVAATPQGFVTTITVNTVEDNLNFSGSETCSSASAGGVCTLRRAIVEARNLPAAQRPALIAFNLPPGQANTGDAAGTWTVTIGEGVSSDLRDLAGDSIMVDGATQPGGRATGPKVFIRGSTQADRFTINGNNNTLHGLGFQYIRVLFTGSNNLVENSWSGLQESGQEIYFLRDNPQIDARASFEEFEASTNNTYRNVVVSGSRSVAITMRGSDGLIENSFFGTRSDGTVPFVEYDRRCRPNAPYNNWFGGSGITLSGPGHTVRNNRFVGLLYSSRDPFNTPSPAILVEDGSQLIENNIIGIDSAGQRFGTCGDGINMTDELSIVRSNTIYGAGIRDGDISDVVTSQFPQTGAIGLRGGGVSESLGANTFEANIIEDSIAPVFFFPSVSDNYKYFNPAKVTSINGRTVSGTSGDPGIPPPPKAPVDSTCPNCIVQLFIDNRDGNIETLLPLGSVTADVQGNWTATDILPVGGLEANQGIRTQTTTVVDDTIIGFDAGTTTKVSRDLYGPEGVITVPLPPAPPMADQPTTYTPVQARPVPARPNYIFATTITVDSTADPDVSQSTTCASSPCTLRRAIVQARGLPAAERPVLIRFNIPTTDPGYNSTLGVWRIDLNTSISNAFRDLRDGAIVIDGTTQPGGRADGPKIFMRGRNNQHIMIVNDRDNIIRGLGFQGFGIQVNSGGNFVEDNWFGLNEDGNSIYYVNGDNTLDNDATIQDAETPPSLVGENVYRNNVVTGSRATAMTIRSDDAWIVGNYIGTRADGTIPAPSSGFDICDSPDWVAGGGIVLVGGQGTQVGGPNLADRNYIVGLRNLDPNSQATQPFGIQLGSVGEYYVENNYIGRDVNGDAIGVCGEGIRVSSNFTVLKDNFIYTPFDTAINHLPDTIGANANTYVGNQIIDSAAPIVFGPVVPDDLKFFNPARITEIDGVNISGTSGLPGIRPGGLPPIDSSCPFCTVEIFWDNDDTTVEALQSLGTTQADAQGNWSFTLPQELGPNQGLRTLSTINNYGVISYYEAGTSTKLSTLYTVDNVGAQSTVFLPMVRR